MGKSISCSMTLIQLHPHGPTSFTVSVDGVSRPGFWTVEALGKDRYRLMPVFPRVGPQRFEVEGDLVRWPRRAHDVFWKDGKIQEVRVNVEERA